MRLPRPRGMTLIELMLVVAIVGVLSTVAAPSFLRLQLRAKQAERGVVMTAIRRSIDALWVRDQKFPTDVSAGESWLYLTTDNPDAAPGPSKRAWRTTSLGATDQWNLLPIGIEGAVYYSYGGYAYTRGNTRVYYLYAYGDLDGDGNQNRWEKYWIYVNDLKQIGVGTLDCGDCSFGFEGNPSAF